MGFDPSAFNQYAYAFNQVGDDNCMEMDENSFSRLLEWIPEVWKANAVKVNVVNFLGGSPCSEPIESAL